MQQSVVEAKANEFVNRIEREMKLKGAIFTPADKQAMEAARMAYVFGWIDGVKYHMSQKLDPQEKKD